MENAAKSIIMVGGVIIGTMVMSIMIYLFSVFGSFSGEMSQKMNAKKYLQFNNNYFQYQGRIDITAQEIKSIINFTKEHNDSTGIKYGEDGFINVFIDDQPVFKQDGGIDDPYKNIFLENANNNFYLYRCEAEIVNGEIWDMDHVPSTYNLSESEKKNYDYFIHYKTLNLSASTKTIDKNDGISKNTFLVSKIFFYTINDSRYNLKNKEKCIISSK